jgi:hypothetical protein
LGERQWRSSGSPAWRSEARTVRRRSGAWPALGELGEHGAQRRPLGVGVLAEVLVALERDRRPRGRHRDRVARRASRRRRSGHAGLGERLRLDRVRAVGGRGERGAEHLLEHLVEDRQVLTPRTQHGAEGDAHVLAARRVDRVERADPRDHLRHAHADAAAAQQLAQPLQLGGHVRHLRATPST